MEYRPEKGNQKVQAQVICRKILARHRAVECIPGVSVSLIDTHALFIYL